MTKLLFVQSTPDRTIKFILRLSTDERKFLDDAAEARGVNVTTMLRTFIRVGLSLPASDKQALSEESNGQAQEAQKDKENSNKE